jgi:nucleotide-binding universal stress UspA family protein
METALKILLAVDGSDYTIRAAQYLATHFEWLRGTPELHLLHVTLPIPMGLAVIQAEKILGWDAVDHYYKEAAEAALAPAEELLREKNIPFQRSYKVGDIAKEIQCYAEKNKMDMIVMGSHGHGALKNLVMGSIATNVLAATNIPVLIVR